ncbi:MAG: GNAT family N-acetyltransferase [Defluviitaleaceae bacterium]|nr:GNAT family N-acetyltransferase [Defluviitaleaceae bacterium]
MEIRELKPSEHKDFHQICQTVFFDIDRDEFEKPADDENVRIGAFDAQGKLQAALMVLPYVMRMNGRDVKMGGLGAVVSRPETRGQGHMPALMRAAFDVMRKNGQIFSFLYPFSFAYYRKFGYEMCFAHNRLKIPVSQLGAYKREVGCGQMSPDTAAVKIESASDTRRLKKIYEHFTREQNLAIVRSDAAWEKFLDRDACRDLEFSYLFSDDTGQDVAYILYGVERDDDDGNRLIVEECCWVSPQCLHMVLGFLARLGAEFEYVIWNAPTDFDVLFPEAFDVERRVEVKGMNRILDIPAALETLRAPDGIGRVTLGVTDDFLQENTGVYAVEWGDGAVSAKKIDATDATDFSTSVQTLAQLVTGYITPEIAALKKDTAVNGAGAELSALFIKRNQFITEWF